MKLIAYSIIISGCLQSLVAMLDSTGPVEIALFIFVVLLLASIAFLIELFPSNISSKVKDDDEEIDKI